jgi:hypothetical protein
MVSKMNKALGFEVEDEQRIRLGQANGGDTESSEDGEGEVEEKKWKIVDPCLFAFDSTLRPTMYSLAYGLIQGLYKSENYPADTGCWRCKEIALPISNFMGVFPDLIELLSDSVTLDSLGGGQVAGTEQLMVIYDGFLVFWEIGANLKTLLNAESI